VRSAPEVPLIVVVSRACSRAAADSLKGAGAEIVTAAGGNEQERVCDALQKLGELGIQSMLLEGGPRLAGAFQDAGEIDEMRIFIAPIALGGRSARAPLEGEGVDSIAAGRPATGLTSAHVGEDVLISATLKEW
jgi:diaminohydroxyphosphoribosylaminopyrimidine deaminase/5-amino-6-(5-phosphoribosylamino)uracil reductase